MWYFLNMETLENIIAENILKHRKLSKLTQAELGEKLNFSDKSVSKWEKGESLPDIVTLKKMCDIFNITLNDLTSKTSPKQIMRKSSKHLLITLLSAGLVWLVATTVFVFLLLFTPNTPKIWLCFIYAVPVTAIVMLVFSCLWAKNIWQFLASTLLIWTSLISLCLTINNIWYILLIGVPLEILLMLLFFLKKSNIKNLK